MYLTPDNAPNLLGKTLDASRHILGVYPYTVIQFPDGTYGAMDRVGVCSPVSNDRFNQVFFDIIDGEPQTENSSEKPNNCEHITEDGVTCAKYPACDDCPDNPLNKVKGSERLVKGSEQTEPTISKMEQVEPQTCSFSDCDNFKNPDYERCIECKRKQIKLRHKQVCVRHNKCIEILEITEVCKNERFKRFSESLG